MWRFLSCAVVVLASCCWVRAGSITDPGEAAAYISSLPGFPSFTTAIIGGVEYDDVDDSVDDGATGSTYLQLNDSNGHSIFFVSGGDRFQLGYAGPYVAFSDDNLGQRSVFALGQGAFNDANVLAGIPYSELVRGASEFGVPFDPVADAPGLSGLLGYDAGSAGGGFGTPYSPASPSVPEPGSLALLVPFLAVPLLRRQRRLA